MARSPGGSLGPANRLRGQHAGVPLPSFAPAGAIDRGAHESGSATDSCAARSSRRYLVRIAVQGARAAARIPEASSSDLLAGVKSGSRDAHARAAEDIRSRIRAAMDDAQ